MTMRARTFVVPAPGTTPGETGPYRWPDPLPPITCPVPLGGVAPVPVDRLSAPTGDDLLGQIVRLAPRGRAWQTDEVQAPLGSTVQHRVWAVVADAMAALYAMLTRAWAASAPSTSDEPAIEAWERDYGLPDACLGDAPTLEARRQAVRAALVPAEDASRRTLICLAGQLGYDIEIEEWEALEFGANGFGEEGFGEATLPFVFFIIAETLPMTWIELGAVGFGEEGFGSFPFDNLICLVERQKQSHTQDYFSIEGLTL